MVILALPVPLTLFNLCVLVNSQSAMCSISTGFGSNEFAPAHLRRLCGWAWPLGAPALWSCWLATLSIELSFLFRLSAVELFRCLHVERQQICTRSPQLCASLPDVPRASTRSLAEFRTFSLRRFSRRPQQSRHRCSRPPL